MPVERRATHTVTLSLQVLGALVCALGGVAAGVVFIHLIDYWRMASDPSLKTIDHFVMSGLELVAAALVVETAGIVLLIYGKKIAEKFFSPKEDPET